MAKRQTQQKAILEYMKNHKEGITSMTAFELFGVTRLSARIFDLRKLGYDIVTNDVVGKNRFGGHCMYANYKLTEDN